MSVRAKFKVVSVTNREDGAEVKLNPVTSGSDENKNFFKYTPYGEISLGLISNETAGQFQPGQCFYVDFTKA